ncbi:hypothetical protein SESBI_46883 [Sesbania bispinosa]|nr:hypothetical protein SESBI_46883 [Sesbania bispinosa]
MGTNDKASQNPEPPKNNSKAQKGKGPATTKAKKGKGPANKPSTSTAVDNLTPEPVNSVSTVVNPPPAPINPPPAPINPHPAPVNPPTTDVNPHPVVVNPPPASINQQPDWSNMTASDQIGRPQFAQEVTSAKAYDWKKVASQLGLSDNEPYMNFMNQVDEAKNLCGFQDYDCTTICDGSGGTQTSDVTTTNKDA